MKKVLILSVLVFLAVVVESNAQTPTRCASDETSYNLPCLKYQLTLVDRQITVKVYAKTRPKKALDRTFVVVHANEKNGLDGAKKVISENYGRLVEIVANAPVDADEAASNKRARFLYFKDGKCIDPNRIYSRRGIEKALADPSKTCGAVQADENEIKAIERFAANFIKIVTNNFTLDFIIGVHNNNYTLSPDVWSKDGGEAKSTFGIFLANDHTQNGVFPTSSNNFVLVTNGKLFGKLLDSGIKSLILQENRAYLTANKEQLDDGSMSIYFGMNALGRPARIFDYINIEAGGKSDDNAENRRWQKETIKKVIEMKKS